MEDVAKKQLLIEFGIVVILPAFASLSQIPRDGATVEIRAKGGKKLQYFF